MNTNTKEQSHRSIGQRYCQPLGRFIYNRKSGEICGRDGKCWSKLAAFYFFFYITLAGFFCLYLSIIMIFIPLNRPRYIGKDSRLTSRSNPLSPGLSFRPQIKSYSNDLVTRISLSTNNRRRKKRADLNDDIDDYVRNLDEFLASYSSSQKFTIADAHDCNSNKKYGFSEGKPCILIKMNKLVGFVPEVGRTNEDHKQTSACPNIPNIPVRCVGEKPSDQNALGNVMYYSESGSSNVCGSIDIKHFPYDGKGDSTNSYQSPYVWVQFINLTPDVLISVECRIFGNNIFYDKLRQRASIRFQLSLNKN